MLSQCRNGTVNVLRGQGDNDFRMLSDAFRMAGTTVFGAIEVSKPQFPHQFRVGGDRPAAIDQADDRAMKFRIQIERLPPVSGLYGFDKLSVNIRQVSRVGLQTFLPEGAAFQQFSGAIDVLHIVNGQFRYPRSPESGIFRQAFGRECPQDLPDRVPGDAVGADQFLFSQRHAGFVLSRQDPFPQIAGYLLDNCLFFLGIGHHVLRIVSLSIESGGASDGLENDRPVPGIGSSRQNCLTKIILNKTRK
jgi:hypothetical protein